MVSVHPQYITDTAGQRLVVLPVSEFNDIMEELDELEDICLYDEAKKEDTGERILFSDYLNARKLKRGKYTIVLMSKAQKQLDKLEDAMQNRFLVQ